MIFDTLDQHARYELPHSLHRAFKYLLENDLDALPLGRIEIDGDNLYALVQEYTTKPVEQGKWEAHRKYIDVQYVTHGQERMGFANLQAMSLGEYLLEKDFQALTGKGNGHVDVFAGSFALFFPQDGHMPGLCVDTPEPVRKVVLKVRI